MGGVLDGKTAIVTGAGAGIGRAIARRFHAEGARVVLADADEKTALAEAAELCAEKQRAIGFRCDPASRLDLNNLMAAAVDAYDYVDVLVNAAADVSAGEALEVTEADFDKTMTVNVKSAFLLTQLAARHMIRRAADKERKGGLNGAIVNVTAPGAGRVIPSRFAQGVSMAALEQLTRGFAVALAEHGVRVNGVTPGGLVGKAAGLVDPGARKSVVARTPMGRLGEASEVAEAALFLASDQASFITGQVIAADGGRCVFDMALPTPEEE